MTILRSGSATDVGRVRSVNEDQALETTTLFAVADGMGGHAGGDIAAQTAIRALEQRFAAQPSPNGLIQAVRDANSAVWERSYGDPDLRGMGTTITAIGLVNTGEGDHLVLANVGDSRAYRLRGGRLEQLTVDHSVAEELVARGELTPAEAEVHPHRHILTRALGVAAEVDVDVWEVVPQEADRLVLCSDGLTNEVPDDAIAEILSSTPDPRDAAQSLVDRANAAGGSDNVTVVVIDVLVAEEASAVTGLDAAGVDDPDSARPATIAEARAVKAAVSATTLAEPASLPGNGARSSSSTVASATIPSSHLELPPSEDRKVVATDKPRRRDRPRRPRRITFRVFLFVLVVAAVGVGAWMLVRWYANASYFVGLGTAANPQDRQLVIYQGRPGGVLGIQPKIVARTGVTLAQLPPAALLVIPNVKDADGVEEPSLNAALSYVHGLKCDANELAPASAPVFPGEDCATTAVPPPPTTTTTKPGAPTSTTRAVGGRGRSPEPQARVEA
jgi:protein phosphatase